MQKGLYLYPYFKFKQRYPEKGSGTMNSSAGTGFRFHDKINYGFIVKISFIGWIIQTIFIGILSATNVHSQGLDRSKVSMNLQGASMLESLRALEESSGVRFCYFDEAIRQNTKKVSLNTTGVSVRRALAAILQNSGLRYKETADCVVIEVMPPQFRISGKVVDADGNAPLAGVSIRVKGSQSGVTTNGSGNFSMDIPEGGATLVFTYLGYERKEVPVSAAERSITVSLSLATTALGEVTVQANKRTNTEVAVLDERRLSAIVQDAISAQQIERTASITTTQALQRVSGVTVTDDKYVAIRGLGDRSVIAQLNGVRLASSDPDRSAIPLDLVPASLLDNITIYKTVTPDKPADAAAGIVELKTKSVPDSMVFEVIAQTGFNSNIGIGGQYNSFWNSDMGLLGTKINDKNLTSDFKALAQQYPDGLGSIQRMIANSGYNTQVRQEVNRVNGIMQGFDPVLTTQYQQAPLNQLYSATFGNSYEVFKKHRLGVILGGNYYRRTSDIYDGTLTQYSVYQGVVTGNPDIYSQRHIPNYITPNSLYMGRYQNYKENTGVETLNYGVLAGLTYRFSPRHQISVQYLGSWGGENQATNMHGAYQYSGMPGDVASVIYSLKQSYRTLNTFNFQGEHKFLASEYSPRLSYNLASSKSSQNDPDYRFITLADYMPRNLEDRWIGGTEIGMPNEGGISNPVYTEHLYALTSGYVSGFGTYGLIQAEPNGRRWRNLDETNYNYKADLSIPFPWLGQKQEFKGGFNYLNRTRNFGENMLFLPGSNFAGGTQHLYEAAGQLDRLVSNDVVGIHVPTAATEEGDIPVGGFLYNSHKSPNNYSGFYETNAFYGMVDLKLTDELRIAGGVRFERTNIQSAVDTAGIFLDPALTEPDENGDIRLLPVFESPNSVYKTNYKPYYSANATYTLNETMNFRAAFNTTLARPELRELTNVFEFDAFQMGLVVGNPNLVNQSTKNADFRWEWFPNPGEVFAISAFGKQIKNQLVKVFSLNTAGLAATYPEFPTIRFENDPNTGTVWGIELEVVKDLGLLWGPARNFFLGSNLLLAQSDIKKTPERLKANHLLDQNSPNNSPLFEQAPYSINGWLNYANKRIGTDITATFNMVGERLVQINLTGEPDLYTRPVPMLDFVFSQKINKRIMFKGYAKNVLNPAINTVYANPGTGGTWYKNEYVNRSYKRGAEVMLGFTYNLF